MIWVLFVAIAEACVDSSGVVVTGGGPDGTDITCALVASSSPDPGCTNLPDELRSVIQSACPLTCGLCTPSTTPCADSTGVVVADDDPDGTDITCALVASSSPAPGCTNLPDEVRSVIQSACPLTCGLCTPSTTPCADSTGVVVADDDPDGTDITCTLVASSSPDPGCTNLPDEVRSVIQSACPLTCGLCTPSTTPCADSTGVVVADDDPDGTDITCALVASSSPDPGCTNLPDEVRSVIQSACPLTCGLCTPSTTPCADSTGVVVADDDPDGTDITCALVASSSPDPGCTNLPDEVRSVIQSACPLTCGLCTPSTTPCADSTGVVVADDDPDGTDITCALVASSSPAPGCTNLPDELRSVIQSACPLTYQASWALCQVGPLLNVEPQSQLGHMPLQLGAEVPYSSTVAAG
ncbi:hypothetical protein AB1Y20_006010 [Prymnesium parvum]|uniref:ShKT domain-containing protein n=1 Tax=Prymnesium parvum TaxID=97485 RepID=A0AB34J3D8_PRYPA